MENNQDRDVGFAHFDCGECGENLHHGRWLPKPHIESLYRAHSLTCIAAFC